MNLTPHFTLEEMTLSQTAVRAGISNTPNEPQILSLVRLCENILEPLRTMLEKPINVSSGFRNPIVNSLLSGSTTSQHMRGEAADINVEGKTAQELFEFIMATDLPYDQLIQEFDRWVHISFGPRKRRQNLYARRNPVNNKPIYVPA